MKYLPTISLLVGSLMTCISMGCEEAEEGVKQRNDVAARQNSGGQPPRNTRSNGPQTQPASSAKGPNGIARDDGAVVHTETDLDAMTESITYASLQIQQNCLEKTDRLIASYQRGDLFNAALTALESAASYTMQKRRDHWRVVQSSEFKALEKVMAPVITAFDPKKPKTVAPLTDILMAGVVLSNREFQYERSAGYALTKYVLERTQKTRPSRYEQPFLEALIARYRIANHEWERRLLIETVGTFDLRGVFLKFMTQVALEDRSWKVRIEALKQLAGCVKAGGRCTMKEEYIQLIYDRQPDERTRGAVIRYAGAISSQKVVEWCQGLLDKGPLSQACRQGLSDARIPLAFESLHSWLRHRMNDPESQRPKNYSFRDEFALLLPYANRYYAKQKYYAILHDVLGQHIRDGYATGGIVRSMSALKDSRSALQIVELTKAFYEAKWKDMPLNKEHRFLLKELDKMEVLLKERAQQQVIEDAKITIQVPKKTATKKSP